MVLVGNGARVPEDAPTGSQTMNAESPVAVVSVPNQEMAEVVFDEEGRKGVQRREGLGDRAHVTAPGRNRDLEGKLRLRAASSLETFQGNQQRPAP